MINANNENIHIFTVIYFITQITNILKQLLPIIKAFMMIVFHYKSYRLNDKETRNKFECYIETQEIWCFKYNSEGKPNGTIIHKSIFPQFFANTDNYDDDPYIFCRKETFKSIRNFVDKLKFKKIDLEKIKENEKMLDLTEQDDSDNEDGDDTKNKILYLYNNYSEYSGHTNYSCRNIKISNNHKFNHNQEELFNEIMNFYNDNKYCKVFISGNINTGKSYFSYILAKKLNCYLCDTFDPTEPSESLTNLYTSKRISGDKPLIVLIDEVDVILKNIHENKIQKHKHYPILVRDKMTWNSFIDKIDYGLYPNLIVIFTSNQNKEYIDSLDKSYIREGRINIFKEFY